MTARITAAEAVALRGAARVPGDWSAYGGRDVYPVTGAGVDRSLADCESVEVAAFIAAGPAIVDALVAVEGENAELRRRLAEVSP